MIGTDVIRRMLTQLDPNSEREGLRDTPERVSRAWTTWTSGYYQDPATILKTFEDGADGCDQIVLVRDIEFYSHCEHHLAPFFGRCHIGYIPDKRIVGLSKLPRLVECFCRRLQVQERITNQLADAIAEHLAPQGVGVVLEARHLCMESRGVAKSGTVTVTSALRGCLKDEPEARAEFLSLIRSRPNVAV
jgi:GTP cyclohydrolase I